MDVVEYTAQAKDIFVLSDSFIRIKELIDNNNASVDDIANVILLDPALAATILKLANSAFFNHPKQIDSISKALIVIGVTEVYNLVIAYFSTDAFQQLTCDSEFLHYFWQQSIDCALIVKFLAVHFKLDNAERLFLLGLLYNLGELVVHQFTPEKVSLCQPQNIQDYGWYKQKEILGFTFAECTAELIKLWHLPTRLIDSIRLQDTETPSLTNIEIQLLYTAKRLMIKKTFFPDENINNLIEQPFLDKLEIDNNLMSNAFHYCDMERRAILSILKPNSAVTL